MEPKVSTALMSLVKAPESLFCARRDFLNDLETTSDSLRRIGLAMH